MKIENNYEKSFCKVCTLHHASRAVSILEQSSYNRILNKKLKFSAKNLEFTFFRLIFAPNIRKFSGLTGFDGEMKWYVSMRRLVGYLLNPSEQKINWRK